MSNQHPAAAAAEAFIEHFHGNMKTFDQSLRGDGESKAAIERVAVMLHEALTAFAVDHVANPAGKPLGDMRDQTR